MVKRLTWIAAGLFALLALVMTVMNLFSGPAHASTPVTLYGNDRACTRTQPEYLVHAGGAVVRTQSGTTRFSVVKADAPGYRGMSAPYVTAGYNSSLNSGLCNNRAYHGAYNSRAYAVPVKLGRQGRPVASVHDITSSGFRGDSGFDIWLTASAADSTYAKMTNGGAGTTEIMIWLNSVGLPAPRSYGVSIDGRKWGVITGLAANGHGRTAGRAGWNVVNFIAPDHRNGNVSAVNLDLNPFMSYAIRHGWLRQSSTLESVNQGFEITAGTAEVAGYVLNGLPH